jgi:hypothetical protein
VGESPLRPARSPASAVMLVRSVSAALPAGRVLCSEREDDMHKKVGTQRACAIAIETHDNRQPLHPLLARSTRLLVHA